MKSQINSLITPRKYIFKHSAFLYLGLPLIIYFTLILISVYPYILSKINQHSSLGFYTIIQEYPNTIINNPENRELLKSEKYTGKIKSYENNMGIILVRFNTYNRINDDELIFRLGQKGMRKWYYEHTYKVDQFWTNQYFTFGFPLIRESRNKIYNFEIESVKGKPGNAVSISSNRYSIASVHNFTRQELMKDPIKFIRFIEKKLLYALFNSNVLFFTLIIFNYYIFLFGVIRLKKSLVRLLNLFKLSIVRIIRKVHLISKFTIIYLKALRLYQDHRFFIIFLTPLLIFFFSFISRFVFYSDIYNLGRLVFSGIGGFGDYDIIFKHAVNFNSFPNKFNYVWWLVNDYPILVPMYATFFKFFGFIPGLKYSIILQILLGSFVSITPFLILSKMRDFSIGGLIAGLFLAFHWLPVWIASGRSVDNTTMIFFSIFVFLYIYSIKNLNWYSAILLGIIGFIDGFNRGVMVVNDLPALFLFGLLFITDYFKSEKRFFSKSTFMATLYAFTPLTVLLSLFLILELWFLNIYKSFWFIFINLLINSQRTGSSFLPDNEAYIDKLITIINNIFLMLLRFLNLFDWYIYIIFLFLSALIFISSYRKFKLKHYLYLTLPCILIISYWKIHVLLDTVFYYRFITQPLGSTLPILKLLLFSEFIALSWFILRRKLLIYISLIFFYMLLLTYGIRTDFQERHYIQVVYIIILFTGAVTDVILKRSAVKWKFFPVTVLLVISLVYYGNQLIQVLFKLPQVISFNYEQKKYLHEVGNAIPANGIILAGSDINMIWISENTKKPIAYNINNPDPVFIPYGQEYFHIPFVYMNTIYSKISREEKYIFKDDVNMKSLLTSGRSSQEYKFYILDYNIEMFKRRLNSKVIPYPSLSQSIRYSIRRITLSQSGRSIYQLTMN